MCSDSSSRILSVFEKLILTEEYRTAFVAFQEKIQDSTKQNDKSIALQALSSHLELLNHLSLTSTGRRCFLQSSIFEQIMKILNTSWLIDDGCNSKEFFHANVRIITYSIMLLCNLAYEKTMFLLLKRIDIRDVEKNLKSAKDSGIKFAHNALSTILGEDNIDEDSEPLKLKQDYVEFVRDNVFQLKQRLRLSGANTYQSNRNSKGSHKMLYLPEF